MKILVIFTGGTIGTTIKNGWANVDDAAKYTLLDNYKNKNHIEFVTSPPYSILSENLSAKELNLLQKEINDNLSKDFDGIIITHGTDTLQYSAAAVEYAFDDCGLPIILVSADYPLHNPKSNGYANFEGAVEFIKSKSAKGVFVSYKNDNECVTNIHIASHILQHSEQNANIYSIDKPFAVYDGKITLNNVDISCKSSLGIVNYVEKPHILVVESNPANDYSYCLDNVNAIILKPYHSGTLNTSNNYFKDFCNRAKEKSIPVFVMGTSVETDYESKQKYDELNIKVLPLGTYISAYMKIWAGISLKKPLTDFMQNKIANEIIK